MAITLLSQPSNPNVTGTKLLYQVSGSDISHPQYSYVMDVYYSGSTELLVRQFQVPNPDGNAEFQPSQIFNGYLSYDNFWKINQESTDLTRSGSIGNPTNAVKTFNVKFGEAYSTSISSSVTVYPGSSDNYIQVFPGTLDPSQNNLLNDGYNFRTASFGISNGPRSNLLTNYPTQNFGSGWIEDTQFFTKADYATVTQYNNTATSPTITNVNVRGFLNTGDSRTQMFIESLSPGAYNYEFPNQRFFTWGVGPKNLSNVLNTDEGRYVIKECIESGSVNEIDLELPGLDETRYFIRDNVFNNRVFQSDLDPTIEATSEEDSLRVPLNKEYIQFAFINQFGFYDFYDIYQPLKRQSSLDKEKVSLPKVDYSKRVSTYSIETGGETSYYTDIKDTYSITTDWLGKTIANYLEEIFDSPEVYIRQGDDYVPILILNKSYKHNNSEARNKLFQYTIEFAPSNGRDLYSEEYSAPQVNLTTFKHTFTCDDLPSTTAVRVDDEINLGRYTLPTYSKDWRIGDDVQTLRLEPTGSISEQQSFFYTGSDITFSPRYRTGGFGTTFDDNTKIDITITGDGNTIFTTSSVYVSPSTRNLEPTPFTASFTGNYNEIIYSSSLSRFLTNPVMNPTWWYRSDQPGGIPNTRWEDTFGIGDNVDISGIRVSHVTGETLGGFTSDWYEYDPWTYDEGGPNVNSPAIFTVTTTHGRITGSNFTIQGWFYVNEFVEISAGNPGAAFYTYRSAVDGLPGFDDTGSRFSVYTTPSGSEQVLTVRTEVNAGVDQIQTFPSQIINTGSWNQITLVKDGDTMADHTIYVNKSIGYSPTSSVPIFVTQSDSEIWGGYRDNNNVLSGSQANMILYDSSSLTQEQVYTNYDRLYNYLSI